MWLQPWWYILTSLQTYVDTSATIVSSSCKGRWTNMACCRVAIIVESMLASLILPIVLLSQYWVPKRYIWARESQLCFKQFQEAPLDAAFQILPIPVCLVKWLTAYSICLYELICKATNYFTFVCCLSLIMVSSVSNGNKGTDTLQVDIVFLILDF